MAIRSLDANSIHALTSGQVVTSLASAVKELLENSLDAGATSIDIRLVGAHGTAGFSVSDNGSGISASEYDVVAKKHYTSKLSSFDDLATVRTFGFRGEALASLCALSEKVTITTAVEADAPLATVLELDNAGNVLDKSKKVARQRGTTVQSTNLFSPLPVRRKNFVATAKRDFPKLLALLTAYALVPCSQENKGVRLNVTSSTDSGKNSKTTTHIRTSGQPSLSSSISTLWGGKQLNELSPLQLDFSVDLSPPKSALKRPRASDEGSSKSIDVKVRGYISNPALHGSGRAQGDRQYFFFNGRPCSPAKIQKAVSEVFRSLSPSSSASSASYPVVVADFILPTDCMDINVSPDKRTILLHGEDILVNALREALESAFSSSSTSSYAVQPTQTQTGSSSRVQKVTTRNSSLNLRDENDEVAAPSDKFDEQAAAHDPQPSPISEPQASVSTGSETADKSPVRTDGTPRLETDRPIVSSSKSKQVQLTLSTASASWSLARDSSERDREVSVSVGTAATSTSRALSPGNDGGGDWVSSRPAKKARTSITDYYTSVTVKEEEPAPTLKSKSVRALFRGKLRGFASQSASVSSEVDELMDDVVVEDDPAAKDVDDDNEDELEYVDELALDPEADMDVDELEASRSPPGDGASTPSTNTNTADVPEQTAPPSPSINPLFLDSPPPPSRPPSAVNPRTPKADKSIVDKPGLDIKEEDRAKDVLLSEPLDLGHSTPELDQGEIGSTPEGETSELGDDNEEADTFVEVLRPNHFPLSTQSLSQTLRVDEDRITAIYDSLTSSTDSPRRAPSKKSSSLETAAKDAPSDSAPSLDLRVIHKQDFLSVSSPSSSPASGVRDSGTPEGMSVVGQFNLGFIIVRLVRNRKARAETSSQAQESLASSSSDEVPASEGDEPYGEQTDDLFIVDQHAADEKYNFETLQTTTRIHSQKLVRPRPLELTAADELIAIENADVLRENGFEISVNDDDEDVDEDEVRIIRDPQVKDKSGRASRVSLVSQPISGKVVFDMKDLEELLELLQTQPTPSSSDGPSKPKRMVRCTKARAMFASRACRKSVMIGKALTKPQMTSIVRHMGTMDQPWNCPHGRPTMRHLTNLGGGERKPGSAGYTQRPVDWANFI